MQGAKWKSHVHRRRSDVERNKWTFFHKKSIKKDVTDYVIFNVNYKQKMEDGSKKLNNGRLVSMGMEGRKEGWVMIFLLNHFFWKVWKRVSSNESFCSSISFSTWKYVTAIENTLCHLQSNRTVRNVCIKNNYFSRQTFIIWCILVWAEAIYVREIDSFMCWCPWCLSVRKRFVTLQI